MAHSDICFDFNAAMAESIGDRGIQEDHIHELKADLCEIHQGLQDLRKLGQLPFMDLPFQEDFQKHIQSEARRFGDEFDTVLLVGIGGSALGTSFLAYAFPEYAQKKIIICDHLDTLKWQEIESTLDFSKTLFLVISKSGQTTETWAAFLYFCEKFVQRLGSSKASKNIFVITDPQKGPMRKLCSSMGFSSLSIPEGVGGRYSVLSAVGLFPMALLGFPIEEIIAGARRMSERSQSNDPWINPSMMSAALHHIHAQKFQRTIRVSFSYGEYLKRYGAWFSQLWAESLGKEKATHDGDIYVGTTSVRSQGPQDQHSQLQLYLEGPDDKVVTFVASEESPVIHLPQKSALVEKANDSSLDHFLGKSVSFLETCERLSTEEALKERARPSHTILFKQKDLYSVGQLIYMAELETVYAGQILGINPFDQPSVELIKNNIKAYLSGKIIPKRNRNYMI